jgi:anaerobic selenocysteine-containing dehydrogenase
MPSNSAKQRDVVLMNPADIVRGRLRDGQLVTLVSDADDGVKGEVGALQVTPFRLPAGCIGGYDPELNMPIPLSHTT